MRLAVAALVIFAGLVPAKAADWFKHRFGELRAYHGSWLAVCAEDGAGDCRAVQSGGTDGVDGSRRVAVHVVRSGRYIVTVFQRDRALGTDEFVTFDIDGDVSGLRNRNWRKGEMDVGNVAETFTITDGALNGKIVVDLKAGGIANVGMGTGSARRVAAFDLSGITVALDAIEAHIARRES